MNPILVSYDGGKTWELIERRKAIRNLSGAWKPESIEPMLQEGQILWTPFAQYKEAA